MKKQKDSSLDKSRSEQILQKLSTLEELIKKKNDKPLTFKEACSYLGYAPSYLYKLTYRKVIPHYKPTGKMIFFSKNEIDEWIFRSSDERKVMNDEFKEEKNNEKDPNQMEMGFDEKKDKRNEENNETEILIEFPLKSRKKTIKRRLRNE
ncbi:MAG: helix-turn-helix domain-containing protein [Bacteroidota bacterium]